MSKLLNYERNAVTHTKLTNLEYTIGRQYNVKITINHENTDHKIGYIVQKHVVLQQQQLVFILPIES